MSRHVFQFVKPTLLLLQLYSVGLKKEWALGCVNHASRLPRAAEGAFTQPRAHSFAQLCIQGDPCTRFTIYFPYLTYDNLNCRLNGDTEGEAVKNVLDSTGAFNLERLKGLMDVSR